MRPMRVFGSALGVLAFVGCVTPAGGPASSRYETSAAPAVTDREARLQAYQQVRDSLNAQAIADKEGPGVSVRVELTNVSGSRRARAAFTLEDDAYVIVGHIDADGVLRLTFPGDPSDDGFVKGGRSYQTTEFFAGFLQEYRYRATSGLFHYTAATPESYDGGLGYVFVIASWRPMHFDRFSTDGAWDTFELADADYVRDPRPAVYELASLLAGENREAYTVKFARYSGTMYDGSATAGYSSLASSAFSSGYCFGSGPLGYAWSPFALPFGSYSPSADQYGDFYYRGTEYLYNSFGNCYTTYRGGTFGSYYGTTIAQGPASPPTQTPARIFDIDRIHTPPTPQPLPGYKLPVNGTSASGSTADASTTTPRVSTHYRDRGLITPEEPSIAPVGRNARIDARTALGAGDQGSRPSIQQMIMRHEDANSSGGSDGWSRAQGSRNGGNYSGNNASQSQAGSSQQRNYSPDNRGSGSSGSSGSQQQVRSEPARSAPAPSPAPSYSAPRSAPSSPPPAPAAPSAPASSAGSSSGSGAPIKP